MNAPLHEAREAAVKKITDQSILELFARNSAASKPCIAAIKKLTNRTLLASIAKNGGVFERIAASSALLSPADVTPLRFGYTCHTSGCGVAGAGPGWARPPEASATTRQFYKLSPKS